MPPAEVKVEGPREVAGHMALLFPVAVVFRSDLDPRRLHGWTPPADLLPIIARVVRESFRAPYGHVKVIAGHPGFGDSNLNQAFLNLGLQHDRLPDVTAEESSMLVAEFIMRYFDGPLVHEALGGLLKAGVKP